MAKQFWSASFTGGPELVAALNQLGDEALGRGVMVRSLKEVAEPLAEDVAANADRRSGRLAEGVQRVTIRSEDYEAAIAVGPARSAFYGMFEEFGTSRQAPDPFMRPAFDLWRPNALAGLAAIFWHHLARAARRLARMR